MGLQHDAAAHQRDRLSDLGFPERGEAMRVYRPLPPDAVPEPEAVFEADEVPPGAVAVAPPPPALLGGTRLGQALAELAPERAREVLTGLLGVANALAVADELPLAEPRAVTRSLAKAVRGVEGGLVAVAKQQGRTLASVLAQLAPLDLFRAGATLDESLRPERDLASLLEREENADDWAQPTEEIAAADRTVDDDGRTT